MHGDDPAMTECRAEDSAGASCLVLTACSAAPRFSRQPDPPDSHGKTKMKAATNMHFIKLLTLHKYTFSALPIQ
jgi:hypothetical protein